MLGQSSNLRPDLGHKTVLLIDRCEATREVRAGVLRSQGVEVHVLPLTSAEHDFSGDPMPTVGYSWTYAGTFPARRSNSMIRSGTPVLHNASLSSSGRQSISRATGPRR